jgi:hypothetical protein
MLTDEQKAEIDAKLDAIFNKPTAPPKPKVVTSDGIPIRDAKVRVSVDDFNAHNRGQTEVVVEREEPEWIGTGLRPGTVRINTAEADRQWHERDASSAVNRHQRQALRDADPMNVWGSNND